ncbi:MAG: hypothetical protein A2Y12_00565 [Planctomycetes bacterium GWF2_42_9]|nr:MAG: hypothetical protein A2Y12_00565 [Planctomycetes bacterium GWF2_42_9]
MSLGDHIEDLRLRLILAIAGLTIAVIVCLFFGKNIIMFIEKPYVMGMGKNLQLHRSGHFTFFCNIQQRGSWRRIYFYFSELYLFHNFHDVGFWPGVSDSDSHFLFK